MSVTGIFTGDFHEQDKRWSAVDAYTISHLHPASRPNSKALIRALEYSRDQNLPDIASYPALGKFFALQCKAGNVKYALEIGTLGGYTSLWLATENHGIQVTTVEVNPHHAKVARENLEFGGVGDRVNIIEGAGLDVVPKLLEEVRAGEREKFGFVYLDADKENNWTYLDMAIGMCVPGATIFVDNMVSRGRLVDPKHQHEKNIAGARKVVEMVGNDERVDAVVMQLVGEKSYDGVLMAVVR